MIARGDPGNGGERSAVTSDQMHPALERIGPTAAALRASELTYRTLLDKSSDGILIADRQTKAIRFANQAAVVMLGYTKSELSSMSEADLHPKECLQRVLQDLEGIACGIGSVALDIPCLRKDGTILYADVSGATVTIDGRAMAAGFFRDVTERWLARHELEASEIRYRRLFESTRDGVLILDAETGRVVDVNPFLTELTGYSRADLLGQHLWEIDLFKEIAAREGSFTALQATKCVRYEHLRLEGRDGRRIDVEFVANPYLVDDQKLVQCNIRDITAQKRIEAEHLALEAQFLQAQKMEAVGLLAGGIAHDFNNVLSVILSYAELIGGDLEPDEPLRTDVEEIRTAALHASELTRQLLAFSRQQVLETRVLDLYETATGMEKMLGRLLGAGIQLTVLPASGLWSIRADSGQIEQVVMNLAVNARDAMPSGGELTIETRNVELDEAHVRAHRGLRAGSYVKLAVSDTGIGMDGATQERIFEPFFSTKERGKGTGLGLATVFRIVKQSGGHIRVYSEPGRGAIFNVYFPRVAGAPEVRATERAGDESRRGTETILLVEDDDQVRPLAQNILRRCGYVVLVAPNGGEALLICEKHGAKIHLLLTDVVLPRMSGRQLAERLVPMRPGMKVLFMSGHTDDAVLQHGVLDSGVAYLQKPLTPASLTGKVREVLGMNDRQ